MSDADPPQTPAEQRLDDHLEVVRSEPPAPRAGLVRSVLRSVRWQNALRAPLRAVGQLAASVMDVLGVLFGVRRGHR